MFFVIFETVYVSHELFLVWLLVHLAVLATHCTQSLFLVKGRFSFCVDTIFVVWSWKFVKFFCHWMINLFNYLRQQIHFILSGKLVLIIHLLFPLLSCCLYVSCTSKCKEELFLYFGSFRARGILIITISINMHYKDMTTHFWNYDFSIKELDTTFLIFSTKNPPISAWTRNKRKLGMEYALYSTLNPKNAYTPSPHNKNVIFW